MSTELAKLDKAALLLSEAKDLNEVKKIRDMAEAARTYAKAAKLGQQAINHATSIKFLAERKMGQMLKETPRASGGQPYRKSTGAEREPVEPTLSEIGLTKKESSRAQMLASLPEEKFEEVRTGQKPLLAVKREIRLGKASKETTLPDGKFRVIYADPPWSYGNQLAPEHYGPAKNHYATMSIQQLCDMPIKDLTEENSVLFLWVTSPLLNECWPVIKAWGFDYKTSFVWDKVKHNMGHYNSVRHEFLLICTRGSCTPDAKELHDSVISLERSKTHSEKPEYFRELIGKLYTHGRKLELFSRKVVDGWERHGNEILA